jgi:hypothetical protein
MLLARYRAAMMTIRRQMVNAITASSPKRRIMRPLLKRKNAM